MKLLFVCCFFSSFTISLNKGKAKFFPVIILTAQETGQSCVVGFSPPLTSPSWLHGRWILNHNDQNTCSGKLKGYHMQYYNDIDDGPYEIYLSIWRFVESSYELVEGSLKPASVIANLNKNNSEDTSETFIYIYSGSVVGVYVPDNDYLTVVGYEKNNMDYGVCRSSSSVDENAKTITCSSSSSLNQHRLHVTANIEIVDCGSLDSITNGNVTLVDSSTEYGSAAQYICSQPGYVLDGNEYRYCTENSTWNGTEPSCVLFNCTHPGDIGSNGQMEGDSFTYGSTLRYSCNSGYYITGDSVITCGANMTWNRTQFAYCSPVSCEDPGNVTNGNRKADDFKYQSIASFTCDFGYELTGSNVIECLASKTWNDSIPTCDLINCGDPGVPKNGFQLNNSSFTYNSTVLFLCSPGYMLSDDELSKIVCMANGNWSSGTLPVCSPVFCDAPTLPANGTITNPHYIYNYSESVSYECDEGYFLNGSDSTMCIGNKQWSNNPPNCLRVCNDSSFSHVIKDPNEGPFLVGTVLQLSCDSGYELHGESTVECLMSGEWNNTILECKAVITTTVGSVSSSILTSSKGSSSPYTFSSSTTNYKDHSAGSTQKTTSKMSETLSSSNHKTSPKMTTVTNSYQMTMKTTLIPMSSIKTSLAISSSITNDSTHVSTGTDSSSAIYGTIVPIVFIIVVLVILSVITIVLCLVKKKSKKYEVNSPGLAGHDNPIINTELYGTSMLATATIYKPSVADEDRGFSTGADYEDINELNGTVSNASDEGDYTHINTAITVQPTTMDFSMSSDAHCNPMYMETSFICESEEVITEKMESFYASNDDTPILEEKIQKTKPGEENGDDMAEYKDENEKLGESVVKAEIDNAPCDDYDDIVVDITAPLPSFPSLPSFQSTSTLPLCQSTLPPASKSISTNISELYIKTMPKEKTFIFEAPASEQSELMSQLKSKNVKNISKNSIKMGETLGAGFYGTVYKGKYTSQGGNVIEVAVKTLKEGANSQEKLKFLQEAFIMAQFKHINVLKLHGIVVDKDTSLIVTEFMEKGDLKDLLKKLKPDPGELGNTDLSHTLLNFSRQVCMGLVYLAEKGFVHRDVAARNILVNANNICKVADFGLSRELEDEDYYLANKQAKVPVKWTAPEAIHYRKYSSASDVWSFGCLLYEIWSLGQQPYTGITNMESIRKVESGYRLPPPPGCSAAIYGLMIKCWHPEPRQRPRFQDIMLELLQQDAVVLSIPDKDLTTDSQAGILGASLKAGEKLYNELQQTYLVEAT